MSAFRDFFHYSRIYIYNIYLIAFEYIHYFTLHYMACIIILYYYNIANDFFFIFFTTLPPLPEVTVTGLITIGTGRWQNIYSAIVFCNIRYPRRNTMPLKGIVVVVVIVTVINVQIYVRFVYYDVFIVTHLTTKIKCIKKINYTITNFSSKRVLS